MKRHRWHGTMHVEAYNKTYMLGEGETITIVDADKTNLCTIEIVGSNSIRVHEHNEFWENHGKDVE